MGELNNQLWASADILRGKMDASEYKNYLLGLVFYKYLSDHELRAVYEEEHGNVTEYPSREEQFAGLTDWYNDDAGGIRDIVTMKLGYFIEPDSLFYTLRKRASAYELQISDIQDAFLKLSKMTELNAQIKQNEAIFLSLLDELAVTDETRDLIEATKRIFA